MTGEEFERKSTEILAQLPQEFHAAVAQKAYEDGHSGGYEEVLIHLQSLVEMLKKPVEEYAASVLRRL